MIHYNHVQRSKIIYISKSYCVSFSIPLYKNICSYSCDRVAYITVDQSQARFFLNAITTIKFLSELKQLLIIAKLYIRLASHNVHFSIFLPSECDGWKCERQITYTLIIRGKEGEAFVSRCTNIIKNSSNFFSWAIINSYHRFNKVMKLFDSVNI